MSPRPSRHLLAALALLTGGAAAGLPTFAAAAPPVAPPVAPEAMPGMPGMAMPAAPRKLGPRELPPIPKDLPAWMSSPNYQESFYKRASYNFAVYGKLDTLSRDMNGTAVGHAFAYEDMVLGRAATLETKTFDKIVAVLKNPPKLAPGEQFIAPKFTRTYGEVEKVFDWTHTLHSQTIDVLVSNMPQEKKNQEIENLWAYYKSSVPYTVTGLPMNMGALDSQPYSGTFRKAYPKVNGLFWGYHYLQTAIYDTLWKARTNAEQRAQYDVLGKRYREVELYRTDRDFMPMTAETSPDFARRFPYIANAFDNLHMLHDMLGDILASDWMTAQQKEEQVKRAVYLVTDDAHKGEKAGDFNPNDPIHDHRFAAGQPGMGMMKMSTPDLMYMSNMGWMNMSVCGHCSMPMDFDPKSEAGGTVTAEGWTMNVRCMLCARDMASQTQGQAIIRGNTEDPNRPLILISDDQGNWTSNIPGVTFLEVEGSHAGCSAWSRAFTSRAAFDKYVNEAEEGRFKGAKPLTLEEWSKLQGDKPDTYEKPEGPVPNPYKDEPAKQAPPVALLGLLTGAR